MIILYPGTKPGSRTVRGLISTKPVPGRLLEAALEQGSVTELLGKEIKKKLAKICVKNFVYDTSVEITWNIVGENRYTKCIVLLSEYGD